MLINNLCKNFNEQTVIKNLSLEISPKTITCIMGSSGCGKTTLLNIIAGLEKPSLGSITFQEGEKQNVSYLFQEPRLLPWLTVLDNVKIVLNEDEHKAKEILQAVELDNSLYKYPNELSGGMKQRVSIARAFAFPSSILLMDEPFQNLDIKLKNSLIKVLIKLWETNKKTVLWVTHDITEACLVADCIVCMGSTPMRINTITEIPTPRAERTTENTSSIQSKIYRTLIL